MAGNAPLDWKTDGDGRLVEMTVFATIDGLPILAGIMKFRGRQGGLRQCTFSYDKDWLAQRRPALFPHGLGLKRSTQSLPPHEIPLPFYDASPDGWGKAILGMAYPDIKLGSPEYIAASGPDRVGNLQFGPGVDGPAIWIPARAMIDLPRHEDSLEDLVEAADAIENGVATRSHLAKLLDSGADIGGARPKTRIRIGDGSWIVKLRSNLDVYDVQRVEAACLSVAAAAGIEVPEHRIESIGRRSALLIKRFDRSGSCRFPYTSAATVLDQPPSIYRPESASYADLSITAKRYGIRDCSLLLFDRMLLNCFLNNTDDHLHNHGFIDDGGGWRLSPVFDVVPQAQRALVLRPARGVSAVADPQSAMMAYPQFGIDREQAEAALQRIRLAVSSFREWLRHYGVTDRDMDIVARLAPHAMLGSRGFVQGHGGLS